MSAYHDLVGTFLQLRFAKSGRPPGEGEYTGKRTHYDREKWTSKKLVIFRFNYVLLKMFLEESV